MLITRRELAGRLAALNLTVSVATVAAVASGLALHRRVGHGRSGLEGLLGLLLWSYLGGTPVLCAVALLLGPRRGGLVRLSYALFALWLVVLAWSMATTSAGAALVTG